jgi:hypothetical protein
VLTDAFVKDQMPFSAAFIIEVTELDSSRKIMVKLNWRRICVSNEPNKEFKNFL